MSRSSVFFNPKISALYSSLLEDYGEDQAQEIVRNVLKMNCTDEEIELAKCQLSSLGRGYNANFCDNIDTHGFGEEVKEQVLKVAEVANVHRSVMKLMCSSRYAKDDISALNYGLVRSVDDCDPNSIVHCTMDVYRQLTEEQKSQVKRITLLSATDTTYDVRHVKEWNVTTLRDESVRCRDYDWLRAFCIDWDLIMLVRTLIVPFAYDTVLAKRRTTITNLRVMIFNPKEFKNIDVEVFDCDILELCFPLQPLLQLMSKVDDWLTQFKRYRVDHIRLMTRGYKTAGRVADLLGDLLPYCTEASQHFTGQSVPWLDHKDNIDQLTMNGDHTWTFQMRFEGKSKTLKTSILSSHDVYDNVIHEAQARQASSAWLLPSYCSDR